MKTQESSSKRQNTDGETQPPEIDKEYFKSAYDKYHELFRHYSSLLFQARVLIISLNLILIGYNFGYLKVESTDSQDDYVKGGICFMSAVALLLFYSMEVIYIQRLQEVAISIGNLEEKFNYITSNFFTKYKPMPHWSLLTFYTISSCALLFKYLKYFNFNWLASIFVIFPVILLTRTLINQKKMANNSQTSD